MSKRRQEARGQQDKVWEPLKDSTADKHAAAAQPKTPQTQSPSYRLAFADEEFLCSKELRPVRLQLELAKTEMILSE